MFVADREIDPKCFSRSRLVSANQAESSSIDADYERRWPQAVIGRAASKTFYPILRGFRCSLNAQRMLDFIPGDKPLKIDGHQSDP
jgi:hypothetical protein